MYLVFYRANNCHPTYIRVFTDENNKFEPQIITEAIHLELDGLDKAKVLDLKEKSANDELYKYCNDERMNEVINIYKGTVIIDTDLDFQEYEKLKDYGLFENLEEIF